MPVPVASHIEVLGTLLEFRDEAVAALDREAAPVYRFITSRLANTSDVSTDPVFQFVFRSYYRLDNAGLGEKFKVEYFRLLQQQRGCQQPIALHDVCHTLAQYETRRQKQSLQFSFATKLIATLDPEMPIYDSYVASVFGFNPPYHVKDFSRRLGRFVIFYEELCTTCRWLTAQTEFVSIEEAFAVTNEEWYQLPKMKRVDFVLWATGKAIEQG